MFPAEYLSPDGLMMHAITFLRFEFTNPPGEKFPRWALV